MVYSSYERATGFDNAGQASWNLLSLRFWKLAEGVGNAPAFASVSVGDVAVLWLSTAWAGYVHPSFGWQADPTRQCRVASEEWRVARAETGIPHSAFLTHHSNGCQTWTRTKTSGLTGRRATLTLSGNGSPGRSRHQTTDRSAQWEDQPCYAPASEGHREDWRCRQDGAPALAVSFPFEDVRFAKCKPPALFRLEDGCLMNSTTAAI